MLAIVICTDVGRRSFLIAVVRQYGPGIQVQDFASAIDAVNAGRATADTVQFVVLALTGGGDPPADLPLLQGAFPQAPLIVELEDDAPEVGFEMVRLGAFVAVAPDITRTKQLWDIITKAMGGGRPYPPIVPVNRPDDEWGFMSMTFNPGDQNHNDYFLAVSPVMKYLALGLHRLDEIPYSGPPELRSRIKNGISGRPVLVAQISSHTPNTMYEIGLADAQDKTIIPLRRTDGDPLPAVLQGIVYVEYSTMTELAMKLFFGLGGTRADL